MAEAGFPGYYVGPPPQYQAYDTLRSTNGARYVMTGSGSLLPDHGFVFDVISSKPTGLTRVLADLPEDWKQYTAAMRQQGYSSIKTDDKYEALEDMWTRDTEYNQTRINNGYSVDYGYRVHFENEVITDELPAYELAISTEPLPGYTEFVDSSANVYTTAELEKTILKTVYGTDAKAELIMAQPETDRVEGFDCVNIFGTYHKTLPTAYPTKLQKTIYSTNNTIVGHLNNTGVSTYYIQTSDLSVNIFEELYNVSVGNNKTSYYDITGKLRNYFDFYHPSNQRMYIEYWGSNYIHNYFTNEVSPSTVNGLSFNIDPDGYYDYNRRIQVDTPRIMKTEKDITYSKMSPGEKSFTSNPTTYWVNNYNATLATAG